MRAQASIGGGFRAKKSLGHYKQKNVHYLYSKEVLNQNKKRDQGKQQWLQDSSQTNADNLNSVRHETSRHFRKRHEGIFENFSEYLQTSGKNKNIRELCTDRRI